MAIRKLCISRPKFPVSPWLTAGYCLYRWPSCGLHEPRHPWDVPPLSAFLSQLNFPCCCAAMADHSWHSPQPLRPQRLYLAHRCALARISFAFATHSASSQCTERSIPPLTIRPSYRFASYSGIPNPIRAPVKPPTAPPTPKPANAPTIGPAAINGPTPGIARAPIPANHPSVPPITAPEPAPAATPSGTFVVFLVAKSFDPTFSGRSTETSVLRKPACFRESTASSTLSR